MNYLSVAKYDFETTSNVIKNQRPFCSRFFYSNALIDEKQALKLINCKCNIYLSVCTGFYKQHRNQTARYNSEAQKLVSLKIWNALLVGAYSRICLCQSDSVSIKNK